MPQVRFAREPLTQSLWDEALPLLFAHWKEVAHYQDIELTPDRARYQQLEANGVVRVFTARTDTAHGVLIGYALFTVTPSLHYKQISQAQQDVIYVQPSCRGTMPIRFIAFCTEQLFAEGVDVVYHHSKKAHDFGVILKRQGFEEIDILYGKRRVAAARPAALEIATSVADHR